MNSQYATELTVIIIMPNIGTRSAFIHALTLCISLCRGKDGNYSTKQDDTRNTINRNICVEGSLDSNLSPAFAIEKPELCTTCCSHA